MRFAVCVNRPYSIAVRRSGTGAGQVTSTTVAIDCGATCSALAPIGSYQVLAATPAADSRFAGWSGSCSGTADCALSMSGNKSVTATFAKITYPLSVSRSGSGSVVSTPSGISCGSSCSRSFATGTAVTLSAKPASGWRFAGWGGACSGTGACAVTTDAAKSVSAVFASP